MLLKKSFFDKIGVFMSDFVTDFTSIVEEYTDSPKIFITASAYSVISCTLGPFYNILNARNKKANLFIVLASPPGLGRRSEVMSFTNIVKETAITKYVELKGGKLDCKHFISAASLESGTPQGLIDDIIAYKESGAFSFLLTSPEFGNAILKTNKINYRLGFESLLCKLWSGESHTDSLSRRGENKIPRYLPRGTYFGIYAGMQKAEHYLDRSMSNSGLLRRLLIASVKGEDLNEWLPPLGGDYSMIYEKLTKLGENIGEKMFSLSGMKNIELDSSAEEYLNRETFFLEKKARNDDENPYYLYKQTHWEHLLKIAANDAISRGQEEITMLNINRAVPFVDEATKNIRGVLENLLVPELQSERQKNLDRFLKLVRKGMKKRQIQQQLSGYGVRGSEFGRLVKILIDEGKIEEQLDSEGKYVLR